jgi:hypothetical protein
MDKLSFNDSARVAVIRKNGKIEIPGFSDNEQGFKPFGFFKLEVIRNKIIVAEQLFPNLVVNQGKNDILDVYFNGGTATAAASWFMGLISSSGFTSIVAADTAASHAGWTEFTGYTQSTRPAWGQGAASSQSVTNASPVTFDINATGTVNGGFIITNSTKGSTSGKLWSAASFASAVPVTSGDQLKVTYTLSS